MPKLSFSLKNYYALLLPIPLAVIIYSYMISSWQPLVLFIIFCLAGIIGEVVFSAWWHHFYGQRFWVYATNTLLNKYTSSLNFLAWGLGGFITIFLIEYSQIIQFIELPFKFSAIFSVTAMAQLIVFHLFIKRIIKKKKFHKVTLINYIFFTLPILIPLLILSKNYGINFLITFLAIGIIMGMMEYLFGKVCKYFLSKKLWIYNYVAVDKGHFTILSLPIFSTSVMYFWMILEIFKIVF